MILSVSRHSNGSPNTSPTSHEHGHEKQTKQSVSLTTFKTASSPPISNQLISLMRIFYTYLSNPKLGAFLINSEMFFIWNVVISPVVRSSPTKPYFLPLIKLT